MRTIVLLAFICLVSCSKEPYEVSKLMYDYNPAQALTIDIELVVADGVGLLYDDLVREVNADYFNRYGIGVDITNISSTGLPDGVVNGKQIFTPDHKDGKIRVYIIPSENIYLPAMAYSIMESRTIVLGEDVQTNRTLAHEIGHLMGLEHSTLDNNVMTLGDRAGQYGHPNDFSPEQVDIIVGNLINR